MRLYLFTRVEEKALIKQMEGGDETVLLAEKKLMKYGVELCKFQLYR